MKIYVGNLSFEVTEEDLRLAFEPFGQVESATIIKDKYSGRSKGFGFAPNTIGFREYLYGPAITNFFV